MEARPEDPALSRLLAEITPDEVARAAASPADARARATAVAELNLGARAEHERLAQETERVRLIAELGDRMTHYIDGAPLEIGSSATDPETIELRHLLDPTRWAVYAPFRGVAFRLWRRGRGDHYTIPYEDFAHADAAENAALDWILRR